MEFKGVNTIFITAEIALAAFIGNSHFFNLATPSVNRLNEICCAVGIFSSVFHMFNYNIREPNKCSQPVALPLSYPRICVFLKEQFYANEYSAAG